MKNLLLSCVVIAAILFSSSLEAGRKVTPITVTTSGSRPAGIRKSTWIFSSNFVGTITDGTGTVAYTGADLFQAFDAPDGEQLEAITYTISAGNIRITEIR